MSSDGEGLDADLDELGSLVKDRITKEPAMPQVSSWDDDEQGIEKEMYPHENPAKEALWAAENGKIDVLTHLLETDRSLVHVTDKDNYTPLHRASYNNHSNIVKILLLNGADHSAKTIDDWQPLHSACKWNSLESAVLLISYGADINAKSKGGVTPLHLAAGHADANKLIQLMLLNPELVVDLKDSSGDTAQDIARRCGPHGPLFEIVEPSFL